MNLSELAFPRSLSFTSALLVLYCGYSPSSGHVHLARVCRRQHSLGRRRPPAAKVPRRRRIQRARLVPRGERRRQCRGPTRCVLGSPASLVVPQRVLTDVAVLLADSLTRHAHILDDLRPVLNSYTAPSTHTVTLDCPHLLRNRSPTSTPCSGQVRLAQPRADSVLQGLERRRRAASDRPRRRQGHHHVRQPSLLPCDEKKQADLSLLPSRSGLADGLS